MTKMRWQKRDKKRAGKKVKCFGPKIASELEALGLAIFPNNRFEEWETEGKAFGLGRRGRGGFTLVLDVEFSLI